MDQTNDSQHWGFTFAALVDEYLRHVKSVRVLPAQSIASLTLSMIPDDELVPKSEEIQQLGQALEAQRVVWGTYKRNGAGWDFQVHMMNIASGENSTVLEARSNSWLVAPSQCAQTLLSQLNIKLDSQERQQLLSPLTRSLESLELVSRTYDLIMQPAKEAELAVIVTNLEKALKLDPKFLLGIQALAVGLAAQERVNEGLKWAKRAVEIYPNDGVAHYTEGMMYIDMNLKTLANEQFSAASKLEPDDPYNYLYLAGIAESEKNCDEALRNYERSKTLAPYDAAVRARLGYLYATLSDRKKALPELNAAGQFDTGFDVKIKEIIAEAYDSLNDQPTAVTWYEKYLEAVKQTHQSADTIAEATSALEQVRARMTPQFVTAVAPLDISAKDFENVLKSRLAPEERLLVINPLASTPEMDKWAEQTVGKTHDQMETAKRLFDALLPHANVEDETSAKTAADVFKQWSNPKAPFLCQDYAFLYVALARHLGLRSYVVWVDRDYQGTAVHHACAGVVMNGKVLLVDPAYRWFGVAHKSYEFEDDLRVASYFLGGGTFDKCKISLKLTPDWAYLHLWYAVSLAADGQLNEAGEVLQTGLKLDSKSSLALYAEGVVELANHDYTNGTDHLERSLSVTPDNSLARWALAAAYREQGKLSDAREQFRIYLQGNVDSKEAAAAAREAIVDIDKKLGQP